jgi:uncharacterized repeat protein (TIGR03803 family)
VGVLALAPPADAKIIYTPAHVEIQPGGAQTGHYRPCSEIAERWSGQTGKELAARFRFTWQSHCNSSLGTAFLAGAAARKPPAFSAASSLEGVESGGKDMEAERHKPSFRRALAVAAVALNLCAPAHAAPKYKVLHSFIGTDGSGPWGGVAFDRKGNLYGTTASGGTGTCGLYNCGVVFQVTPHANGNWTETTLYDFVGGNDGATPYDTVILDGSGNIYGTNTKGGAHEAGTAFELAPSSGGWGLTTLYAFCPEIGKSGCEDGGGTQAGLTLDQSGNLYGPKSGGGGYAGSVFELTSGSGGWGETILYTFGMGKGDGAGPHADLIFDSAGNLYGTTQYGGIQCGSSSCGTVYELSLTSSGWVEAVLHRFHDNGKDGFTPGWGALAMDQSGRLYGSTRGGGCCGGVVYKLTPHANGEWKETIVYEFNAGGYEPNAGVVMDKSGNLYGTTDYGGSGDCGVIYRLAPKPKNKWKYTVLHTFSGNDGCFPEGNLVLDKNGNLYGGTVLGGANGNGVIFELTP